MKLCTIVLFSLLTVSLFAQRDQARACELLGKLKGGVLLVRLYEGVNKYEAMKKRGLATKAEVFKKTRYVSNLGVVNALKKKYTFSRVAFFYGTDTEEVLAGKYTGHLLNDSLKRSKTLTITASDVFIAEMGSISAEAFGSSVEGFAIFDGRMKKITKPFPHFVARRGMIILKRSDFELVDTMEYKLKKLEKKCP